MTTLKKLFKKVRDMGGGYAVLLVKNTAAGWQTNIDDTIFTDQGAGIAYCKQYLDTRNIDGNIIINDAPIQEVEYAVEDENTHGNTPDAGKGL